MDILLDPCNNIIHFNTNSDMNQQTSMFTTVQQTGSAAQSNMLDLIRQNEERISALRTLPHTFHSDPGHAWLAVCYSDLIVLDILGQISECSYRDKDTVYLEEDMDAGTYITALFGKNGERTIKQQEKFIQWRDLINHLDSNHSFVRNLPSFRG
jgi:hypothetical protein